MTSEEIIKRVRNSKSRVHPLRVAELNKYSYFGDFLIACNCMQEILGERVFSKWLDEKMLLNQENVDNKQFIEYAIETAVARYCFEKYSTSVKTEVKVCKNSQKDVDVQFERDGFIFNIEVKCPTFYEKELSLLQNGVKFQSAGRPDNFTEVMNEISKNLYSAKKFQIAPNPIKNMDNNLKSYLIGAHKKFSEDASDHEINILLVGCNDAWDLQSFYNYLYSDKGLFTDKSFAKHQTFNNVDIVILTNLYYKHNNISDNSIGSFWSLEGGANLIFKNSFAKINKQDGYNLLLSSIPNYMDEFNQIGKNIIRSHAQSNTPQEVIEFSSYIPRIIDKLTQKHSELSYFKTK